MSRQAVPQLNVKRTAQGVKSASVAEAGLPAKMPCSTPVTIMNLPKGM